MQVVELDQNEVWRSGSGGATRERSEITLEFNGEDKQAIRRAAEDAITDRLGYVGVVQSCQISEPYALCGRLVVMVKIEVEKEW